MFSTFVTLALVLAPSISRVAATFDSYYPTEIGTCQDLSYAWVSTAVWPIDAVIVDPAQPCDDPLIDVGEVWATSASTKVTVKPGQQIQISLLDANNDESWSSPITVTDSGDYSCLSSDVAASLSSAAVSSSSKTNSVYSGTSTTALVLTTGVSTSTSHTSSSASSSGATGDLTPVGAVGTGSDSGAGALTVPVALIGATLATMLFL
ncbi:hypothetical protein BDZ89DRAFT_430435 [Hymenopellis radicata]|nr:hypothetical protein BDZ89DRAFT_430435 [Hymenopellis radicata]